MKDDPLDTPKRIGQGSEKRILELDGLRGIAILQVLIWHYIVCQIRSGSFIDQIDAVPWQSAGFKLLTLTWSGVDLFFVLSGFLLGGILLDNKGSPDFFKVFYVRRFFRIFPLFILSILIYKSIIWAMLHFNFMIGHPSLWLFFFDHKMISLGYYLAMVQNFMMGIINDWGGLWLGITWSLAIEEQFYLVLPWLIHIFPVRRLIKVVCFLILLAPILRSVLLVALPDNGTFWAFLMMPCRSDALLMGVLCAIALRDGRFKGFIRDRLSFIYATAAFLLIFLFNMAFRGQNICTQEMSWYGYTLLALFYSCVLLIAVMERKGFVTSIVRNVALRQLGIIAYGVYIMHQAMAGVIHAVFLGNNPPRMAQWTDVIATIAALTLTMACAKVSWHYFEKPLVALGHTWLYKKPKQAA